MLQKLAAFERLLYIMNDLREKCPWDRKQTFESLRPLTIEETYELADAITENNLRDIKEELGDLLLHIVFYAKIGEEQRAFDIESIITTLCEKLIRRHPHIYGNVQVESEEEVNTKLLCVVVTVYALGVAAAIDPALKVAFPIRLEPVVVEATKWEAGSKISSLTG